MSQPMTFDEWWRWRFPVEHPCGVDSPDKAKARNVWHAAQAAILEANAALVAENQRLRAEKSGWETTCQQLRDSVNELKKENARLDASETQLIGERDRAEAVADSLAYAVGDIDVIGEHSSGNRPWMNALELITPHAEVQRLRDDLGALRAACTPFVREFNNRSWLAGEPGTMEEYNVGGTSIKNKDLRRIAAMLAPKENP